MHRGQEDKLPNQLSLQQQTMGVPVFCLISGTSSTCHHRSCVVMSPLVFPAAQHRWTCWFECRITDFTIRLKLMTTSPSVAADVSPVRFFSTTRKILDGNQIGQSRVHSLWVKGKRACRVIHKEWPRFSLPTFHFMRFMLFPDRLRDRMGC